MPMTEPDFGVRIHRGANEIGGSCVELRYGDATVLLDLGRPLWAGRDEVIPLPPAIGLGEPGLLPLALVLSHGHQDHWGLVPDLPAGIPVYVGKGAADVLRAAEFWGAGIDLHESGHLTHRQPLQIGPFTITPYLADHSAFDAYSLLIEAGGRRLLYSGDFRGHGRKARAFEEFLVDAPSDVDVLLMEGTNLRADDEGAESQATESVVETELAQTLTDTDGLVVVLCSAQNIDRLVTVYRAALRAERNLAVDLYTAEVAAATGRDTIPQVNPQWPRVSAYLPLTQRVRVKQAEEFTRTEAVKGRRIFDEQLVDEPGQWVLFGAFQAQVARMLSSGQLAGGAVVWSMWDGYLKDARGQRFVASLEAAGVPLIHHHTSGHASVDDLKRFVVAVDPAVVVPIHTEAPEQFEATFGKRVVQRDDGQWWSV